MAQRLKSYGLTALGSDVYAGFIVAVMLVPQAMAYAMLAGLPPVIGLYSAALPLLAYALAGTSRQLAVGPVAMISLLVAEACGRLATAGSVEYIRLATVLAVLVGLFQLVLGLARAGFLANFVSHAVISGFTSAGAITIGLGQIRHLLGLKSGWGGHPLSPIAGIFRHAAETNLFTLAMGLAAILTLVLFKRLKSHFPAALLVAVAGALMVYGFRLDNQGVGTVGTVPGGFPSFTLPQMGLGTVTALLPASLAIVFVGFMESIAVAQWIAAREKYRIDSNRELLGLGLANLAAGLFGGYCVTGGFSRTAVNYQAGAKSQTASVVTAALVMATLLALTPLFRYLPGVVLAAVIIVAVAGLVDLRQAARLFRIRRADGWTWLVTFLLTLAAGVDYGIVAGILFSLLLFIARSSHPHIAVLGYLPSEDVFHDVEKHPGTVSYPDILMVRIDASLFFANARFAEDFLRRRVLSRPGTTRVLADMSGVNNMDAEAVLTLERLADELAQHGVGFALAGAKSAVRDVISRSGWSISGAPVPEYPDLRHAILSLRGSLL